LDETLENMRTQEDARYEQEVQNKIQEKQDALARRKARRFDAVNVITDDLSFDEKEIEFGLD
jgi:hypothetical protein